MSLDKLKKEYRELVSILKSTIDSYTLLSVGNSCEKCLEYLVELLKKERMKLKNDIKEYHDRPKVLPSVDLGVIDYTPISLDFDDEKKHISVE